MHVRKRRCTSLIFFYTSLALRAIFISAYKIAGKARPWAYLRFWRQFSACSVGLELVVLRLIEHVLVAILRVGMLARGGGLALVSRHLVRLEGVVVVLIDVHVVDVVASAATSVRIVASVHSGAASLAGGALTLLLLLQVLLAEQILQLGQLLALYDK